ncbi:STAS domain-containing protein [Terribacillus sp. DMT04]|uniref:STAS domain-containing protein n=1 Tax=Terribacillus sp. DMT04 TaxID=2850441 RepID=UPI001C2C7482|nr:STAS domain-containing protein [Terribacillus sp. DMT04]QXE03574.1 STAS domain-containing protein [Terribacillus sp. DMT04]
MVHYTHFRNYLVQNTNFNVNNKFKDIDQYLFIKDKTQPSNFNDRFCDVFNTEEDLTTKILEDRAKDLNDLYYFNFPIEEIVSKLSEVKWLYINLVESFCTENALSFHQGLRICNLITLFFDQFISRLTTSAFKAYNDFMLEQEKVIESLGSPLIRLSINSALVPLFGHINNARAEKIITSITHEVGELQLDNIFVDLTGLKSLNKDASRFISNLTETLKIMGTKIVISGVHPDIAKSAMYMGLNGSTESKSSLHLAISQGRIFS